MRHFEFVKSSYSSGNGECVEVARNNPRAVAVRDSNRPDEHLLVLTPAAWGSFITGLRRQP
ncbi:DUF397 domain-containing protein [Streptomyces atroolivaceus]|uniref:DUF397 domain-containing protein n=1 Tax=Streptomyces atroolivaceus TaxID=66869 RepID=UPI0037BB5BBB